MDARMKEFLCKCGWIYIVGKKNVYGPIYTIGPGPDSPFPSVHNRCYSKGQLMTREVFDDAYADCAARYDREA